MEFITVKEAAEKWQVSVRRVQILCNADRIKGAYRFGKSWMIPSTAVLPNARRKDEEPQLPMPRKSPFLDMTNLYNMRLSHKYEVEQEELKKQMFDLKNKIERLDTAQNSSGSFIRAIRKFMTMQTLTPIVLQELIDKIEVFPIEGTGKNRTQRLVIHYRFVGCIDLPSIVPKHTYKLDSRQGVAIEYLPSAV